jgi:hypothetical protein
MDRLADEGTDTGLNVMTKYLAQHEHTAHNDDF